MARLGTHKTTTTQTKPSLMARLTNGRHGHTTTKTVTTADNSATHHHGAGAETHHHTSNAGVRRSPRTGGGLFSSSRRNEPVHHHKRHASLGDKVSGGMMKLKGSLTRRPGLKAAGTRRAHGTDGRGSHRVY